MCARPSSRDDKYQFENINSLNSRSGLLSGSQTPISYVNSKRYAQRDHSGSALLSTADRKKRKI